MEQKYPAGIWWSLQYFFSGRLAQLASLVQLTVENVQINQISFELKSLRITKQAIVRIVCNRRSHSRNGHHCQQEENLKRMLKYVTWIAILDKWTIFTVSLGFIVDQLRFGENPAGFIGKSDCAWHTSSLTFSAQVYCSGKHTKSGEHLLVIKFKSSILFTCPRY